MYIHHESWNIIYALVFIYTRKYHISHITDVSYIDNVIVYQSFFQGIFWVVPLPSNSHHQDCHVFSRGPCKPSFATVTGRGQPKVYSFHSVLPNVSGSFFSSGPGLDEQLLYLQVFKKKIPRDGTVGHNKYLLYILRWIFFDLFFFNLFLSQILLKQQIFESPRIPTDVLGFESTCLVWEAW